jgi:hypothetical protein
MGKNQIIPGDTMIKIPKRKKRQPGAPLPKGFVRRPMSASYVEKREKANQALIMKRAGFSWARICEELGYNHESTAYAAVRAALRRTAKLEFQDWLAMHIERTENYLNKLEKGIIKGNPRSVEVAVKVLERQAELLGLDYEDRKEQATQQQHIEINILADPRDDDAQRFLAEIKSRARLVEPEEVHSPLLPPVEGDTQH